MNVCGYNIQEMEEECKRVHHGMPIVSASDLIEIITVWAPGMIDMIDGDVITPAIRKLLLRGGAVCEYCQYPATTVDRIIPRRLGGTVRRDNLAPACRECKSEKGAKTVDAWKKERISKGKPWPIPSVDARIAALSENWINPDSDIDVLDAIIDAIHDDYEQFRNEMVALRDVEPHCAP